MSSCCFANQKNLVLHCLSRTGMLQITALPETEGATPESTFVRMAVLRHTPARLAQGEALALQNTDQPAPNAGSLLTGLAVTEL